MTGTVYNAVRNAQLGTHKPNVQQIPDNLIREEGGEEQESKADSFSDDDEKHRTPKR